MSNKLDNLPTLEVTIGNQETIVVGVDTPADSLNASIVGINLDEILPLNSTLAADGLSADVVLPVSATTRARQRGTILQLAWNFGGGEIENTRVNLKGVICA